MQFFGWVVTLLHISSKTADDIVENNDQVILPRLEAETFRVIGTHDNDYNKKSWQDQVKIFLIKLNWSITKKWKFVDLKFTYRKTVWSRLLKTKWPSAQGDGLLIHWSLLAWVRFHHRRFFNSFYGEMDSDLQFEFSNSSSNLRKNW